MPAEHDQVVEAGGTAFGPGDEMVDITPGRWPVASREDTVQIPGHDPDSEGGVTSRFVRPTSRGWLSGPKTTRVRLASHEILEISSPVRNVPSSVSEIPGFPSNKVWAET